MKYIFRCSTLILLALFASSLAWTQQPAATLTGVVTDPNGAVIPGAAVTTSNKATGFLRSTASNEDGGYVLSNLPAGVYELRVIAKAFDDFAYPVVVLNAGQTVTVNVELQVVFGAVDAGMILPDVLLVESKTSKVDAVIGDKEVENLPLNGRNFLELALLTPGNTIAPNFDPTKTNTVVISSAGQVGRGGNVMADGTDNNDDVVGGCLLRVGPGNLGHLVHIVKWI